MLRAKNFIFLIFIVLNFNFIYSQGEFSFKNEDKRAVTLKFKSVNNLIIVSGILNGKFINFLLDTGVNKTKIFGNVKDSTFLKSAQFISLRSIGSSEPVKAYKTIDNTIDLGPVSGNNFEVYYITDPRFDLSSKLGVNVQGIIGYDFFKNFIVRVNYSRKNLRIYQHDKFNRKLRRFDKIDFRFIRRKPHIKLPVEFLDGTKNELVFLLDTGSSDAFWIFENEEITIPENSFTDYVGYGLELAVEGERSKAKSVHIGKFKLKEPQVAYLDSLSAKLFTLDRFKNGILGGEILRRFVWFFDYKNYHIYLKPGPYFNDNSNYDRSGLVLTYVGEEINKIKIPILVKVNEDANYNSGSSAENFEIRMEVSKILNVSQIRPNSPASIIDIQIGDRILKLNGKDVNRMSLEEINKLLSSEEGKLIKIKLKRGNAVLTRKIYLSSQLNVLPSD